MAISQITAGDNNTFTFSPESSLNYSTGYFVTLSSGITSTTNIALVPVVFNFTTQAQSEIVNPPTVAIISPSNNATNVSLIPNIQIQFSTSVKNINATNIILHEGSESGPVVAIGQITTGMNNTCTFSPVTPLNQATTYYLEVSNGITGINGVPLATTTFNFTTGSFPTPVVSILSPSNNATNVSLIPNIQLQFSTSVKNVDAQHIILHEGSESGPVVAIGPITTGMNNTCTFSPVTPLNQLTTYYLEVDGMTSTNGVPLATTTFNFTTGPNITFTGPENSAYVANGEKMLFTNNSGSALTITSITTNAAIQILFPAITDGCTNKVTPNNSTCSVSVDVPQYYSAPTQVIMTVKYSNGNSNTFPMFVSYLAYY